MPLNIHPLDKGWSFAQLREGSASDLAGDGDLKSKIVGEFLEVDSVPTSVQAELIRMGRLLDPYKGMAEWNAQWIGEAEWVFKTTFQLTAVDLAVDNLDLVLKGLDTFCQVFLNHTSILKSTNMFISHRIPVKSLLRKGSNEISLVFDNAWSRGKVEEAAHGGKRAVWNGDSSRLYVRKAGYHYEWDWGPRLMTVGPWKPIFLESYGERIEDVRVDSHVGEGLDVSVDITVKTEGNKPELLIILLRNDQGKIVKSEQVPVGTDKISWKFRKGEIELWYPVGYGKQTRYTVEVNLIGSKTSVPSDTRITRIGFRRSLLVEEPLEGQPGTSFLFEVNNVRIFIGGANWIPADNFLTNISDERYRQWLQLLVDANMNMIRVWGGGIYEPDVFYDTCDDLGILVWQDFLFGCGLYPAHDEFAESVRVEAEQAVIRLRDHPSLIVWAGNNEDYAIAEEKGISYAEEPEDLRKDTLFPARYLYERVLPKAVSRFSSNTAYRRGCPWGGALQSDQTVGDTHMWNMWHGKQEPFSKLEGLASRFVSEFGMEGAPNIRTVDYWLDGRTDQRFPQSRINDQHNKADGFERRIACYLIENYRMNTYDMEDYVYYTQVMQSEALATAYRVWRRNWKGRGKEYTSGALVWQLNDCWPTTSWAIVDYFLRPKPAYFTIKRELAPYTVGTAREEITTFADKITSANREIKQHTEIWGTNSTLESKNITLEIQAFDLTGNLIHSSTQSATLSPNSSTELYRGVVPGQKIRRSQGEEAEVIIVGAKIFDDDKNVLARFCDWPVPYKYIVYPDSYNPVQIKSHESSISVSTSLPVKGVVFDVDSEKEGEAEVSWGDQALDLLPGDEITVEAKGLNGRKVNVRFIGDRS
ncbi:glycoside hydrolase family 2 protein [Phaffia rhodozyma]|uniref:Beta-mannosidase B n=1 Tax=Phaffia rhodozyma TaxID=264483 RepID=A0A0F7SRS9_PHARH|nr:glycoside hydrolase family 2 protein [Phaffia rhodozyma]